MNNLAILPIVIPLLTGIALVFIREKLSIVRRATQLMALVNLLVVAATAIYIYRFGPIILETGDWAAPFGIVLVADSLSITLVAATNVIALSCAFYAPRTLHEKREKHYFYSLFQILIAGVSGAFITGDIFNLFVFFEVLLMASYGLIVLGGEKEQFRESVKYLLMNLFSSMLFVTTVAFLYAVTGTLNMAHLSERIARVEDTTILSVIAVLLFVVFATKGAVFPLYFWLPKPYSRPPAVISALFGALMTKVGIYAILRVFFVVFPGDPLPKNFLLLLAALTMLFGVLGALSSNDVRLIVAYNIIPAIGFMLMGIAIATPKALAGTIYYLVSDMFIKASLFLLVGLLIKQAGTSNLKRMGGLLATSPGLGWLFLLAAYILAGLPPFGGFFGKLLLLYGALEEGRFLMVVVALIASLLILLSVVRIFIQAFWGEEKQAEKTKSPSVPGTIFPAVFLISFSFLLGIAAQFFYPLFQTMADQLFEPSLYIRAVLENRSP